MARGLVLVGFLAAAVIPAEAACQLDTYNATDPKPLSDTVDHGDVAFRWSSDADAAVDGLSRLWHYIQNRHKSNPLWAVWKKADITIPYESPLPAGHAACNHYLVFDHWQDLDAPIVYAIGGRAQRAAVYTDRPTAALLKEPLARASPMSPLDRPLDRQAGVPVASEARLSSVLESSYLDEQRQIRPVKVEVVATRISAGVRMDIQAEPRGAIIGFSDLPSTLSPAQFERLAKQFNRPGEHIGVEKLAKYTSSASGIWTGYLTDEEYVFFTGAAGRSFVIEAQAVMQRTGTIVVLDAKRRPLLQGRASLLLPAAAR